MGREGAVTKLTYCQTEMACMLHVARLSRVHIQQWIICCMDWYDPVCVLYIKLYEHRQLIPRTHPPPGFLELDSKCSFTNSLFVLMLSS